MRGEHLRHSAGSHDTCTDTKTCWQPQVRRRAPSSTYRLATSRAETRDVTTTAEVINSLDNDTTTGEVNRL
ncbi:unnamed protein product [Protopolystoma xenopodis]|uniref:Uncharacterized protein n=1 Tax=Protopolystoma xenopodis TaxID=117903 RepID=A0A448XJL0_9PLAT|nr:unnamed protein product [Protopolystoma xenopodis]